MYIVPAVSTFNPAVSYQEVTSWTSEDGYTLIVDGDFFEHTDGRTKRPRYRLLERECPPLKIPCDTECQGEFKILIEKGIRPREVTTTNTTKEGSFKATIESLGADDREICI